MPVWQQVFAAIDDPNFVLISAAQDTGGEAVAGPIFDAAKPGYVQIVDENHIISSAFNFVNVPSAAWIDEEGRIVRIDEGAYAATHKFGEGDTAFTFGNDVYAPAVQDWVAKGAASEFVQSSATVTGHIRDHNVGQQQADAAFRLANLFRAHGQAEKAEHYWEMARSLNPDSINFMRQDLTLTEEGSGGATFMKVMGEYISQGKDIYRPLGIE